MGTVHEAEQKLKRLWGRSVGDQNCQTLDEYTTRVARRIKAAYGVEVDPKDYVEVVRVLKSIEKFGL